MGTDIQSTADDPDSADEPTARGRAPLIAAVLSLKARLARFTAAEPGSADEPAARRRAPLIAAGLSFLWPGLGQLFLGRRAWAAIFAVPAVVLTVWAAVQLTHGLWWVGLSMLDESYALTVAVIVVLAGALRVASTAHAFLSAPRARRLHFRPLEAGLIAALLLTIVGMHAYVAADAWLVHQADLDIAANNRIFAAEASPNPSASVSPTATPTPAPIDPLAFYPAPTVARSEPTPARTKNPDRITFLVVGMDNMPGRAFSNAVTDTMMVVSMDTKTGKVTMISVPRDTSAFDIYYGGWAESGLKLNELVNNLLSGYYKSPDAPMITLKKEISFLVGLPIDYYAALDLGGLASMINAIGGIDIYNERGIDDPSTGIEMGVGPVHLNGSLAILYVRSREGAGGSDYQRAARQQALLVALEKKVASPSVLPNIANLISLAGKVIATDFPLETARDYVSAAQHVTSTSSCVLGPPYSYHPDTSTTGGTWTSRLDMALLANLSVGLFGSESAYYGLPGVVPAACQA
jgi:LCP family protein required for cell wall assembly